MKADKRRGASKRPMQGNKKDRKRARQKRRIVSVSRFKKASKGM